MSIGHSSRALNVSTPKELEVQSAFNVASLFRHKTLIVLSTASFLLLGVIYAAVRPTTYTASSQLLAFNKQLQLGPDTVIASAPADSSVVQSQIEIIQSPNALRKAARLLDLKDDVELSAEAPDLSERVQTWLTRSIDLPPAIVEILGWLRSRPAASIWATADELKMERALSSLKGKLSVKRVGSSQIILVTFKHSDPNKAANIVNQIAQASLRDVDSMGDGTLSGSLGLREHIKNLGPSARIISPAVPPIHPDGPTVLLIATAATVLGFGVGAGIALLKDYTDRTIRTPGQAISLVGADCLGLIPQVRNGFLARFERRKNSTQPNDASLLQVQEDPHSMLCNAIRRVSAATLEQSKRGMRTLGVAATLPGEGATMMAHNLALFTAGAGSKVLLVDAVSSDPRLSRLLAPGARSGLIEVVNHGAPLINSVVTDECSGLHFLPLGEPSGFDVDRMWYAPMQGFLGKTAELYDLVIIDLPPLSCAADARLAGPVLDAFLLVLAWGKTESALVQEALRQSGQVKSKMLGTVLNKVDTGQVTKCYRVVAQELPVRAWKRADQDSHSSAPGSAEKLVSGVVRPSVSRGEPQAGLKLKRASS
jgi:polysaccharide biosynthesis transport protein